MTASETPRLPNAQIKYIRGVRFGLLTVTAFDRSENGRRFWLCQCDCGKTKSIDGGSLKRGHTTSCGCVAAANASKRLLTHGMTHSAEFRIWTGMKDRTTNPLCEHWGLYGGRGILVCDEWFDSFETFLADMGPRPSKDHSIERIDNNGNYSKENCRWATRKEQGRNKSTNLLVTYKNETLPLCVWCERFGINKHTLRNRIVIYGWSVEEALNTPAKKYARCN